MFDIFQTIFKYREKQSPDTLGLFPESVHVDAMPERRYLWTSRVLVILSCLSICFSIMLASTVYLLLPQRSVSPKLLQINNYFSQLEQTEPVERVVSAADLIAEEHIYDYIRLRNVITNDFDDIQKRWGLYEKLYWYSDPVVYTFFQKHEAKTNMDLFRVKSLTRSVKIEWVKIMATGLWQAQFLTYDLYPGQTKPTVNIWRATMRIGYGSIPFRNREDLSKNPFGFIVKNYSLGYLGTPETSAHYLETAKEARERTY